MAYVITSGYAGAQAIADTSTTQNHPLATVVHAYDPTLGAGEFIYLKGVASTAVGDAVVFNQQAATTTRTVAASRGPIGFAMSANVANQYGWYQIRGVAVANVLASFAADQLCCVTSTAGSIDDAGTAGQGISGAASKSAIDTPSTGKAYVQIDRPSADGAL